VEARKAAVVSELPDQNPSYERVTCPHCGHVQTLCLDWRRDFPLTICSECERPLADHRAKLRQAVWEASQFLTPNQIDKYVNLVLDEIEKESP